MLLNASTLALIPLYPLSSSQMKSYNSHEKFLKFPLPFIVLLLFSPLFLHFATAKYSPETSSSGGDALDTTNVTPSMALIVIILVFAFFVTGCVSIYLQQCANPSPPSSSSPIVFSGAGEVHPAIVNLTRGLETSVIESFPTFVYSSVKDLKLRKGSLECAVCLSEFHDDEILRLLPKCDHVFHYECIDAWLVGHTTCPVCRANLVPDSNQNGKSNESTQEMDSGSDLESSSSGEVRITIIDGDFPKKRLPKSHSTGHSLSRLGEDRCSERFTLRLPVEVRRQLMDRTKLKRATSMVALPRESSSRWRYPDGGGGDGGGILGFSTDWWSSVRMTGKERLMEM